ncbi:MAG: hypothetical protein O3A00_10365, partial [Planctomycetota bacterium]|nr:hypothetical protein [Planctomycetota bacterium]
FPRFLKRVPFFRKTRIATPPIDSRAICLIRRIFENARVEKLGARLTSFGFSEHRTLDSSERHPAKSESRKPDPQVLIPAFFEESSILPENANRYAAAY